MDIDKTEQELFDSIEDKQILITKKGFMQTAAAVMDEFIYITTETPDEAMKLGLFLSKLMGDLVDKVFEE